MSLPRRRARGQVGELDFEDLQLDEVAIAQLLAQAGDEDAARPCTPDGGDDPGLGRGRAPARAAVRSWSRVCGHAHHRRRFDGQRKELRRFLVDTAVLDELTPTACAAMAGRADVTGLLDRHIGPARP